MATTRIQLSFINQVTDASRLVWGATDRLNVPLVLGDPDNGIGGSSPFAGVVETALLGNSLSQKLTMRSPGGSPGRSLVPGSATLDGYKVIIPGRLYNDDGLGSEVSLKVNGVQGSYTYLDGNSADLTNGSPEWGTPTTKPLAGITIASINDGTATFLVETLPSAEDSFRYLDEFYIRCVLLDVYYTEAEAGGDSDDSSAVGRRWRTHEFHSKRLRGG